MAARRSPGETERRRDPERARQRLLDAAVEEFGAKGFDGARVRDIAARAGLNMQLISYYFGGKAGLYAELQRRWNETSRDLASPDQPLEQVIAAFVQVSQANRPWARLLAWQGLSAGATDGAGRGSAGKGSAGPGSEGPSSPSSGSAGPASASSGPAGPSSASSGPAGPSSAGADQATPDAGRSDLMLWIVTELRRRQQAGELAADLEPGFTALALFAAAAAPAILPHIARELTGLDPESDEFARGYAEDLERLVRHLRGNASGVTPPG